MKASSRYTPGKWTSGDHAALFIETPQGTWKAMVHKDDSTWSVRGPDPDDPLHYADGEVSTADPDVKKGGAEGRYAAAKIRARAYIMKHAGAAKNHATKKTPAQLDREIADILATRPASTRGHATAKRWKIGDKVMYYGRPYTIVREAKPIAFSVGDPDFQDTQTVIVNAFDLIAGDDPDSFDADFLPRIQEDALRVRS
jgi:hypothetical protein